MRAASVVEAEKTGSGTRLAVEGTLGLTAEAISATVDGRVC